MNFKQQQDAAKVTRTNNAMANKNQKNIGNVPGRYYVDDSCIDCDICRVEAPSFFSRHVEGGYSIVRQQPATPEETAQAEQVLSSCPTDSIGNDG